MKKIEFSREVKTAMSQKIQDYILNELDEEIGMIPAEMMLDFFADLFGGYYYNQGLSDAQAVFAKKLDDINDTIYGLEQRQQSLR